jgi:Ecdysteroid kinase-like family
MSVSSTVWRGTHRPPTRPNGRAQATLAHEVMMAPPRGLYGSLDDMLSLDVLSRLEGRTVTGVRRQPFTPPYGGVSGNSFLSIETVANDGHRRPYVVKRTAITWDIIMRVTGDTVCREMLVWRHGLLDLLPPEVGHTVVACTIDDGGWALLMRDISDLMHPCQRWPDPGWASLDEGELLVFLNGLAALHERYWEAPALLDPKLGLCELARLYASFSPATAQREAGSPHPLITVLLEGWEQFERVAAPDLVRLVQGLQADSRPLCKALGRYPWTLVHGDPNCKNFGIELDPNPRILLLDWQIVTRAPPAVDLAYFLALFSAVLPASYEEVIDQYRACLAARLGDRFDERWWRPQLDLALLGHFLRFGGLLVWRMTYHDDPAVREHYRTVLAWWTERALDGARWL